MNKFRSRLTAGMSLILAMLALYASIRGIADKRVYDAVLQSGTISKALVVGSVAQDMVSAPMALILAVLAIVFLIKPGYKLLISMIGLIWYFFYAYGLYVIQGQYTSIYLVYLGIFSLSIYSMICGVTSFKQEEAARYDLSNAVRIATGIYLAMVFALLGMVWILRMSMDIARHIPGETYGVFILDLGVVFPAFAVIAIMLLRKMYFGYTLAGIALLKGFTLCLSWAFAQFYGPLHGVIPYQMDMIVISSSLTLISLLLFIPYILNLKIPLGQK